MLTLWRYGKHVVSESIALPPDEQTSMKEMKDQRLPRMENSPNGLHCHLWSDGRPSPVSAWALELSPCPLMSPG